MARIPSLRDTANFIAKEYGDDTEKVGNAIQLAVADFGETLASVTAQAIQRILGPVTWRQALVLQHHEVTKGNAEKYTQQGFEEFMEKFDHSNCPTNAWDPELRKQVSGCPVAQAAFEASIKES
jgi:hypothetical protein